MRRRTAKWSPLSCLLVVATIFLSVFVNSKNSDFENILGSKSQFPNIISVNDANRTYTIFSQEQQNQSNATNIYSSMRRWSNTYGTARVEPRLFFPVLATPRSGYGLQFKGYRPSKAPPIGYPAVRPPLSPYRPQPPQPSKPTKPSHTYGLPKPTGYPASSNYHHHQEVYITYPPGTSASYPQTTHNNKPSGFYGSGSSQPNYQSTTATIGSGASYIPSQPTSPPSKPNYEIPLPIIPNPSYVTNKPNYVSTSSNPYPSPNPTDPLSIGQTNYPGYPASPINSGGGSYNPLLTSGYPATSLGIETPLKPHYPVPSSSSYPSYPASSGGSYPASSLVGASHLPIFVFIPKPGHFNVDHNSKPSNYHEPSGSSLSQYYPTTRPPVAPIPQYYPPAKPTKPLKPVSVYPAAKPPSTAYGLPKPQRPTQQYYSPSHQSGAYGVGNSRPNYHQISPTSTRTRTEITLNDQTSNSYKNSDDLLTRNPSNEQHLPGDSTGTDRRPNLLAAQTHPSVFQRGNLFQRPLNSQPPHSAVPNDFISLPETSIPLESTGQSQFETLKNQNQSWAIGAESSQIVSVTEYPYNAVNNLPSYQDDFRLPIHSSYRKAPLNDCGGPWVVLQQPAGGFVDPSQVQIEPIYPQSENSHGFNSKLNDQLFRSPKDVAVSFSPFSPGINEHFVSAPIPNNSNVDPPYIPDFLIFSTTPDPELLSTTEVPPDSGEWRKPNSLISSFSFFPSRSIPADRTTVPSVPFVTDQLTFSSGITITNPEDTSNQALTSTENSIILSLNAINLRDPKNGINFEQSGIKSPSPFLAEISSTFSDESDSKETKSINLVTDNNVGTRENVSSIEETDIRLSRNLRSANLRAISSLISQAGIASLFQDKEYTLLAPSNAAFNKISSIQRQRWVTRPDSLREMLLHHVIPSHLNSSSFENEATPATLAGSHHLRINIYNATENRDTITTVNGARVLTTDLRLGKLLVHVIDRVLMPRNFPSQTILDILNDGGLQASLLGPALTKVLSSDSPLSVFVPTTEAFLSVSQDEQRLFLNNETAFHNLLWYHIVPGTYYAEGLEDGQLLSTLHDVGRLRVDLIRQNRRSKLARINGVANVIESDVSASNGVVHFIDRILTDILF